MAHQILVVDDDQDIRNLVTFILEAAGHYVTPAVCGAAALELLGQRDFDLMILDIMMPKLDGWEVCRQLRSHQHTKALPVLILTVRNQPLDRVIGLEVIHADDYVTKPFEREDLLAAVERLLPATPATLSP